MESIILYFKKSYFLRGNIVDFKESKIGSETRYKNRKLNLKSHEIRGLKMAAIR